MRLIGVEAGGEAIVPGRHAARFAGGSVGILQGTRTWVLQDAHGNIELTHSISAGLDYAAVGPEHAWLQQQGRTEYAYATDAEALDAFQQVARLEGILPALESSHGVAHAMRVAGDLASDAIVLVNLSGRGDKDLQTVETRAGTLTGRRTKDELRDVTDCRDVRNAESGGPVRAWSPTSRRATRRWRARAICCSRWRGPAPT